jgi:TrmH family RNA methyltransferase
MADAANPARTERILRGVQDDPDVSSRQNPRFKAALALRDARERRAHQRILVDGAREIGRALEVGFKLVEAWVAPERVRSEAARALLPQVAAAGRIVETSPELLARLAYGDRDEGIVAVFEQPTTRLEDLELPPAALIAVLERVEKPGNLGALLRSADGAGIDAVIAADAVSDIWNPNAIRASVGTIFNLPLVACGASEARDFLLARNINVLAARVEGATDYAAVDLTKPVALVVGAEVSGLSDAWRGDGITAVSLPMLGSADSLNVSATAAVLFYEARRQRRAAAGT